MRRILICGLVLAAFISAAHAASAAPVALQYKFTKGEVEKYTMSMNSSISCGGMLSDVPSDFSVTILVQQKVLEVYDDGSAKLTQFIGEPKVTGAVLPRGSMPSAMILVRVVAKDGRVLSTSVESGSLPGGGGFGMGESTGGFTVLPGGAVEAGRTWRQTIMLPAINQPVTANSRLVSVDGQGTAQIQQDYTARMDLTQLFQQMLGAVAAGPDGQGMDPSEAFGVGMAMNLSGNNTIIFSSSQGKVLRVTGNMNGAMRVDIPGDESGAAGIPISVFVSMSIVKTQ